MLFDDGARGVALYLFFGVNTSSSGFLAEGGAFFLQLKKTPGQSVS